MMLKKLIGISAGLILVGVAVYKYTQDTSPVPAGKFADGTPQDATPVPAGDFADGTLAVLDRDYKKAFRILKPLAERGDVPSQATLGMLYSQGWGPRQDPVRAYAWLSVAARDGNPIIEHDKEEVAKHLTPIQLAEAKKLSREFLDRYVVPFQKK